MPFFLDAAVYREDYINAHLSSRSWTTVAGRVLSEHYFYYFQSETQYDCPQSAVSSDFINRLIKLCLHFRFPKIYLTYLVIVAKMAATDTQ